MATKIQSTYKMVCPKPKAVLGIQFSYWKTNCFGPQAKPFGRGILTFMFFMFFSIFLGIRINRHWLIDIIINNIFLYLLHLFLLPYFFALAAWDFRMVISMEGGEAMFVSDGAKSKSWGTKEARKPLEAKWNLVCRSLLNYQAIVILLYNIDRPPTWGVVQHLTLESPTHQP